MILALAGGVGGAKLARGLADVLDPGDLLVVVNTGDDFEHLGLHVSPDLDTVMYTLAGINDPAQGWGLAGETWRFMGAMETLGGPTWFRLGDRDLATHVERTRRLREGEPLSAVTTRLCARLGVNHHVVPMSDDAVRTLVETDEGVLAFQDYFVRRRAEPKVAGIRFAGIERARQADAVRALFGSGTLDAVVICPSNPYLSIAPILAVDGMRALLERRRVPAIAVSPIVAGRALKGPAAKIMVELGTEASSMEIARYYRGLIDALVIDEADRALAARMSALGIEPIVTQTIMTEPRDRVALARSVVDAATALRGRGVGRP
jgi:LPPG:FO 2-phospho-L-lactate transferase